MSSERQTKIGLLSRASKGKLALPNYLASLSAATESDVCPTIDKHDQDEAPGEKLARKLAGSPASLSRIPIVELARAVVEGRSGARYLIVPKLTSAGEREAFLEALEERAKDGEQFVTGLAIDNNESPESGEKARP
jgi:hypothetical protein